MWPVLVEEIHDKAFDVTAIQILPDRGLRILRMELELGSVGGGSCLQWHYLVTH